MSLESTQWHEVALGKLTRVLGARVAHEVMAETLREVGLARIRHVDELRLFARALVARGGFAGAIGGLLGVHAAMYGAAADPRR